MSEFEEVAYLLIYGKLPNRAQLEAYKAKLRALRGLPATVRSVLERCPPPAHPMDVLRTGVLGAGLHAAGEGRPRRRRRARYRRPAARLPGSMLVYWYHFSHSGQQHRGRDQRRLDRRALPAPAAPAARRPPRGCAPCTPRSSCTPSTSSTPRPSPRASSPAPAPTCTRASPGRSARCAAPSTAAPTRRRCSSSSATTTPDEAATDIRARVASKEVIIGFGHPVYTVADPRNQVIKEVARQLSQEAGDMKLLRRRRAHRDGDG